MSVLYDQTSFSLFFVLLRNFLLIVFNVNLFSCQNFDISSLLLFSKLALFGIVMHSFSVRHRLQRFNCPVVIGFRSGDRWSLNIVIFVVAL